MEPNLNGRCGKRVRKESLCETLADRIFTLSSTEQVGPGPSVYNPLPMSDCWSELCERKKLASFVSFPAAGDSSRTAILE